MQWGSQYDGLNYDPSLFNGESYEYQSFNYVDVAAGVGLWWRKIDRNVAAASAQDVRCGFAVYHFNTNESPDYITHESRLKKSTVSLSHEALILGF